MRPWMVGALLGWMAILAVLAYVPSPPYGTPPEVADKWLDFGRTAAASLLGAIVGAGVAFLANSRLQSIARSRSEESAAHYAMATLMRQFNEYMRVRTAFAAGIVTARTHAAGCEWALIPPIADHLPEDLTFRFENLTFLFDMKRHDVFESLHVAEQSYRDLVGHLNGHLEACKAARERAEQKISVGAEFSGRDIQRAIGPVIEGRLRTHVGAIYERCSRDSAHYLEASKRLHDVIGARFGNKGSPRIAQDQRIDPMPALRVDLP